MKRIRFIAVSTVFVFTLLCASFGFDRVAEASVSQIMLAVFGMPAAESLASATPAESVAASAIDDQENKEESSVKPARLGSAPCVAGEKTWDGEGTTNNWSEAANWTCNAVPLIADIVKFDATSTKDATIDINTSADQFRMNTGYTGTISTAPGGTFSFGRSVASFFTSNQASGNFVCGAGSSISFVKTTFTQTGGNFDCRNGSLILNIGRVNIDGGTFDAPTGSIDLLGFSNGVGSQLSLGSGGTFNHNAGTVFVKSAASINSAGQPLVLNNLEAWAQTSLNEPGSVARILGDLNIVDDNVTKDGKISGAINSVWELHGNLSVSANVTLNSNNLITFAGSGDQTFINLGGVNPSATWRMNKPSGQLILLSDLSNFGSLQLDNGIINAGNFTVSLAQGLVSGGNANSYVIGKVRRQFRAFGAVELFPVGTANGYSPATANFSANGATLTVEAKDGVHPAMNPATSLARYWTVSQTGNATATMTFTYLDGDMNGNENLYAGARINNGTAFLAPVNTATNVITVTGETLFGDFTAGESLAPCLAGEKTWDGEGATNNWSEALNWSCNAVPATTDRVFFNAASSKNVIFDIPVTRAATTIDAAYTGQLSAGTSNLTFNGAFTQSGGTFDGGSGTLDFNGDFTLSAGTFTQSSTLNLFSSFNFRLESAGVFNHNNGTFVIDGPLNFVGTAPSVEQFGIRVEAGHNFGSKSMIANEFVELVGGNSSGGNLETRKNLIIHPTFAGVANIVISGNNARTITLPLTANMPRITLDAPNTILEPSETNGTLTFSNAAFNLLSGTFNANGVNLIFNSTFTQSGGTFNGGTGALTFESGGTLTLTGGTFVATSGTLTYNPFSSVLGSAATFDPNGGTFVVNAPTNFNGPATSMNFHNLTTRANFGQGSRVLNVAGTLNHSTGAAGNGLIRASGDVIVGSGVTGGSGSIEFVGSANQSFTNLGGVYPFRNLTIDKPSGTVTANSPLALRSAFDDLNITSGTLYLASGANVTARNINIAANGRLVNDSAVTLTIGTSVVNNGVVDLQGGGAACNETPGVDPITIISSNANQKPWNGTGVNRLVDVSVTRMGGTGTKTVFSGQNVTGNNSSWVFDNGCPIALSISPLTATLQTGQTQTFTAGGGFAPYTFSLATNNSGGSINPANGAYTAGTTANVSDTIRVTDAFGATADASVNVLAIPVRLAFIVGPTNTVAGQTITPSVQVAAQDATGSTVTSYSSAVTISIASNPGGGTLSGTLTKNAVNGIATFDNLALVRAGIGYTLSAQSGSLTSATSGAFDITPGAPSQLQFTVQPANTANNAVITPAVQIAMTDSLGNVVTGATDQITVALGNNPSAGTLAGTLTRTVVNGIATFNDLSINIAGSGYTLAATSGTLIGAMSNPFDISTLVVTNTNDSGSGSLRQAILDSNSLPGRQSITFNIPGAAPFTLAPLTQLPQIVDPVAIDATTQPGYSGNPIVEINGSAVIGGFGFDVNSGNVLIKGFVINRFVRATSIFTGAGIRILGDGNAVEGNFIGTNIAGTAALPNTNGVFVEGANNTVGGSTPELRNVISGNSATGIWLRNNAVSTRIQGNIVGLDSTGTAVVRNTTGIRLLPANNSTIESNTVSGNSNGIEITGSNNLVRANTIGRNVSNTFNVGAQVFGIRLSTAAGFLVPVQGNMIGGAESSDRNIISGNRFGIMILTNSSGLVTGNRISRNSIFRNESATETPSLGISLGNSPTLNDVNDVDLGANDLQNFPVVSSATSSAGQTIVSGSLNSIPNKAYTIEFFSNTICSPSGYGEGETFLGSITLNSSTLATRSFSNVILPGTSVGNFITATATDSNGNTSEFSRCTLVTNPPQSISGRITNNLGQPMSGVVIRTTSPNAANNRTLTTATNGTYSVLVPSGSTVTLTPSTPNFTFAAPSITLVNVSSPVINQNFVGTRNGTIRGLVTSPTNRTPLPLSNVQLRLNGNPANAVRSDVNGNFSFRNLSPGTYTVEPVLDGFTFTPASTTVTLAGADIVSNFSANQIPPEGRLYFRNLSTTDVFGAGETRVKDRFGYYNDITDDGRRLVGSEIYSLVTSNFDGSDFRVVATAPVNQTIGDACWSPDGSKIAYIQKGTSLSTVRVVNSDGTNSVLIYQSQTGKSVTNVDWSSSANRILISERNQLNAVTEFKTMDATGQNVAVIYSTTTFNSKPRISPDGTKIAFIEDSPTIVGVKELRRMNFDGSALSTLVGNIQSGDSNPAWSPDGTRILVDFWNSSTWFRFIFNTVNNTITSRTPAFTGPQMIWGREVDLTTVTGTNVSFAAGAVAVNFPNVNSAGTTTITPIPPNSAGTAPDGFLIGNQAYEISTTATVTPPITVCFTVPANTTQSSFNAMSVLHNEGGVLVDRTVSRNFATKQICAQTTSLSPFVLGEQIDTNLPSITGLVVDQAGAPMAGVSVALTGTEDRATTTDSDGRFAFVNLTPNGSYNVSPKQPGVLFDEYNKDFVDVTDEQTVVFTGTAQTFSISGTVTDGVGAPLAGTTVFVDGSASDETTTDANGNYTFTNLPADGFYQLTAARAGVDFRDSQIVNPLTGDAAGVDFTAFVPTAANGFIAGRVATSNGSGIRNVTVTATDTSTGEVRTFTTGTFGLYRFDGLETGRTYVVEINSRRFRFTTNSRVISLSDSVGDADFMAEPD